MNEKVNLPLFKCYNINSYSVVQKIGRLFFMPKVNGKMTKSEVLQCRVTPGQRMKLEMKSKTDDLTLSQALQQGGEMYLNDHDGLLQKIAKDVTYVPKSETDYLELKGLRDSCYQLYQAFYSYQVGHPDLESTAWGDTFKDFLLTSIDESLKTYELWHGLKQNE